MKRKLARESEIEKRKGISVADVSNDCLTINAVLANPNRPNLKTEISFVLDTGATGVFLPSKTARMLRLEKVGEGRAELADGRIVSCNIAYVYLFISGEGIITLACFNSGDKPLMGFDIMGLLNLQIDTARRRVLKPLRSFKLEKVTLFRAGKQKP